MNKEMEIPKRLQRTVDLLVTFLLSPGCQHRVGVPARHWTLKVTVATSFHLLTGEFIAFLRSSCLQIIMEEA